MIIDDEVASGNLLLLLIEKFIHSEKELCYCGSPEEALELIKSFKPTLVMLDIEMPKMNGFDFLNRATSSNFDVIFTTAFDQYAIKAIRFSALDYLLKPIDGVELQNAIHRHIVNYQLHKPDQNLLVNNLLNNLQQKKPENFKLALSTLDGIYFYDPSEILYCEGENNYTRFIFANNKALLISKTLGEYEEILEEHGFVRIHKSYLVNKKFITKVDREGVVIMSNGKALAFSRRRKEAVMLLLKSQN